MTCILALDTATEACSVALIYKQQVFSAYEVIPRGHAQRLLPMIDEVLAQASCSLSDIEAIAFGRGPGAFTGVRIAIGVVQGLAFALDIPVIPVSDLAVLAQRAYRETNAQYIAAAIDARMDEVYWGCYGIKDGIAQLLGEESVCAPEQASIPMDASWYGAGTGWSSFAERLKVQPTQQLADLLPAAEDLLQIAIAMYQQGQAVPVEQAQPVYLRDNVATPKRA
ncbi:tRNA (adenosine(37)-N6)-threonylcarbamoyltransferase complex dimerization subunit type 1 TsaB [Pseudomonas sp. F1_0610]|uniref:tRNA (adenosine(37)-N6)-threonylcarbamoyltransferase complex dimerization subunit type 1 TsaB n=1 Tax=Pseudomonas sp. F1_0610 TaxID=3114284 RepID=UPI0039C30A4B